jgi:hypothetical protein
MCPSSGSAACHPPHAVLGGQPAVGHWVVPALLPLPHNEGLDSKVPRTLTAGNGLSLAGQSTPPNLTRGFRAVSPGLGDLCGDGLRLVSSLIGVSTGLLLQGFRCRRKGDGLGEPPRESPMGGDMSPPQHPAVSKANHTPHSEMGD